MCSEVTTSVVATVMDPSVRSERDSQRRASETVDALDRRLARRRAREIDGVALQTPPTPGTADWLGNVLAGDSVLLLRRPRRERRGESMP